ncbi:MAG: hypothetical protein SH850_03895 [Planctomycetaceae bacterium]|nr:hypothetical protein [Planctomycetaceae bacterium]
MTDAAVSVSPPRLPLVGQIVAWASAVAICGWFGVWDLVAEWPADIAWAELGWLLLAPLAWGLVLTGSRIRAKPQASVSHVSIPRLRFREDFFATVAIAALAWTMCWVTGQQLSGLPPAYHDEYSYLFQTQSILHGRWTWPGHPTHPELFDQMHVLNEGRMASRYYPGTGFWLAPWLAMGQPYAGQWCAGAIAAALVYWIGRELGGRRAGWFAGIAFAVAPGPALFGNLLLAHHPTLLALMLFLFGMTRAQRTFAGTDFTMAGIGLACAMLCRPATAAGFALPQGVWCVVQLLKSLAPSPPSSGERVGVRGRALPGVSENNPNDESVSERSAPSPDPSPPKTGEGGPNRIAPMLLGLGLPLLVGLAVMLSYNRVVTGNWTTSPYQLYTDIYTPRHVFGLNNVLRGEQHLGPKVLDDYDRWAENLTPPLAWVNTLNRLIISGLWTLDLPLLAITAVLSLVSAITLRDRSAWLLASIVSLHAMHWPYWYVGIMGWHYVFETAPLWCLLFGVLSSRLIGQWWADRRVLLPAWWCGLLVIAWLGMYVPVSETWPARWVNGVASIRYPRRQHAEFRRWLKQRIGDEPALVLVDAGAQNPHLDLVVNDAGLSGPLLLGRYRPGQTNLDEVAAAFPDRVVYVVRWEQRELERVSLQAGHTIDQ